MKFTDIFVRRPVLATVISLLILALGLRAIGELELRQYPKMNNTVVTVTTVYPGANSNLVKGFITTPLQRAISEANGIDYLSSSSSQGISTIEAHMELNYDPNAAVAEIQAKVASQRNVLPGDAEDPVIDSTTGDRLALMYIAFFSDSISRPRITDYLERVVQPQIQAIPGISKATVFGQPLAMRIWLDPDRMQALNVTADDVSNVLRANNFLSGIGATKGKYVAMDLRATTDVSEPKNFRGLVIREDNGQIVRLQDVANAELGAENYDSTVWYKGIPCVFIAVRTAPGANPLTVAEQVNERIPGIRAQLPSGIEVKVAYDASSYIRDSINEVYKTLVEAVLIVLLVIYLTLGSMRAALVPAVAVPLSLVGAAFVMLVLGYSVNTLTLLSMVLAIGLVVDDAIIVVENVHRHVEMGKSRLDAALTGARELAVPIIAMTTTLLAVYAPIGFTGGLVGSLFTEFAFTLTGAFLISGVVALTLSPMLASKVLKPHGNQGRFEQRVESWFNWLAGRYQKALHASLDTVLVPIVFGAVVLASNYLMFVTSRSELAPVEDQSILFFNATGPRTATIDYHESYAKQMNAMFQTVPEYQESFWLLGFPQDTVFGGFRVSPVQDRQRSQMEIQPELQRMLSGVAGFDVAVFPRPSLPGSSGGLPVQFVLTTDRSDEELALVADELVGRAMQSGKFMFLLKSVQVDRPVVTIEIDRDRAGDLGIPMSEIGRSLSVMLGGGYVNRFNISGRSYRVIPQVDRESRLTAERLQGYFVRAGNGHLVPLSTVVSLSRQVEPASRTQFQQLNSVTLDGVPAGGVALGDALAYLASEADQVLPQGYGYDYSGDSRQFIQQGSALVLTFFMSLLVIYLVLAAQFESWRDPAIILVSVPLSTAGALAFITLGFASVNIYTQVGLITLIGVVAKNGILIVEFANQLQIREGLSPRAAVEKASAIRLRPIIMTSVALIVAMVPLLTAAGPGAVSRFDIGLTIAAGLGIGTLFTLFVLPAFYVWLARDRSITEGAAEQAHA